MEEHTKIIYEYINEIRQDVASVKRLVEDVPAMKQDLLQMKQHIEDLHANLSLQQHTDVSERLELPGTSQAENLDITSETASTISVASTGSEDENTKQHSLRTQCMSEAIQRHFVEMVRRIPFDGIVDKILENDLVTIQENERIREFHADDDKMRYLVKNIMYKSYETMNAFLSMISKYDESLGKAIHQTYLIRYKDESPDLAFKTCTACLIKTRINIKIVGDYFFSRELVSRELHRDITESASTNGNDSIWCRFFHELSHKHPEHIMNVMKDVLTDGEGEYTRHYEDIIQNIDKDIRRHRKSFKCRCSGMKLSISPSFHSSRIVSKRLYPPLSLPFSRMSPSTETTSPPVSPNTSLFGYLKKLKNERMLQYTKENTSECIEVQGYNEIFDENTTRIKRLRRTENVNPVQHRILRVQSPRSFGLPPTSPRPDVRLSSPFSQRHPSHRTLSPPASQNNNEHNTLEHSDDQGVARENTLKSLESYECEETPDESMLQRKRRRGDINPVSHSFLRRFNLGSPGLMRTFPRTVENRSISPVRTVFSQRPPSSASAFKSTSNNKDG